MSAPTRLERLGAYYSPDDPMAHRLVPIDAAGVPFPTDPDDVAVELCWCAEAADCLVLPVRFAR